MKPAPRDFDATAKALWKAVVADLRDRHVLRDVDASAVERYVRMEQVARHAWARIAARQRVEGGEAAWSQQITHGGRGQHSDVRTALAATSAAASYAHDLGITPRARAGLKETLLVGPDPFARFVGGGAS